MVQEFDLNLTLRQTAVKLWQVQIVPLFSWHQLGQARKHIPSTCSLPLLVCCPQL